MAFTPMITIGQTAIPDPSEYDGNTATIVDSARNTSGYMVGAVIRDDVGKVSAKWKYISREQWASILSLFSPTRGGSFTNQVTFFCQDSGDWETRTMYVTDRQASVFIRNPDGSIKGYKNASLGLVEV